MVAPSLSRPWTWLSAQPDRDAVLSALHSRVFLEARGPDAIAMLKAAEELAKMRSSSAEPLAMPYTAERNVAWALLRVGRREEAEHQLAIAKQHAERGDHRHRVEGHQILMLEAALATASGRFDQGKRLAAEALQHAGLGVQIIKLGYGSQIDAARMEQGRLDQVMSSLRWLDTQNPDLLPAYRAMVIGALADSGQLAEARQRLERLTASPLLGFPRDETVALGVRYLPEACRQLRHAAVAAALLPYVKQWAGQILVVARGSSLEGAGERSIGHLLATLGRLDEADNAYTAAAHLEHDAGFPPLEARTLYWHARLLLERNSRGDRTRALPTFSPRSSR